MIIIMDLKDTQRELRTILAELKVQAKRFPSFGIMRTRSRGREIYCKIDYSSGKRKRTIIDHEGVEYRNLLRGLCISAKMELVERNLKMVTDFKKIYKDISQLEIIELMAGKYPRIDRQDIIEAINELEVSKLQPSDWALAQYSQSTYKEGEKTHTTSPSGGSQTVRSFTGSISGSWIRQGIVQGTAKRWTFTNLVESFPGII